VAYDKGDNIRAEEYFERALQNKADDAKSWLRLGMVHTRLGKYEPAEKELRRAAELDPKDSLTHLQLSMLLARLGRVEEATKEAELHKKLKAEESQRIEDASVTSTGVKK
jgi:Flp pilus assembly protein TadD